MNVGDIVQVTATRLGGWDNGECNGRPSEDVVTEGWVGEVVRKANWIEHGGQPYEPGSPGVWWVAKFPIADGKLLYVPCVEPDHVRVIDGCPND